MCGLAGYSTHESRVLTEEERRTRNNLFAALLWAMQNRGTQSTGVAHCDSRRGTVAVRKRAIDADDFLRQPSYAKFLQRHTQANVVVGHTRLATMGEVTRRNAHPFHVGSVVGAHNGIVANWKDHAPDVDVDSLALFHLLDRIPDAAEAAPLLEGRFAVTWFDQRDRRVHLARGGNPLSVAFAPALGTYFWASTDEPLILAGLAAGVELTHYEFPDDALLSLNLAQESITIRPLSWKRREPPPPPRMSQTGLGAAGEQPCWGCNELCLLNEEYDDHICKECAHFEHQYRGDPLYAYG